MKTSCVAKSGYFIRHRLEVRTLCKLSGPFHRPSDCTMGRGKQHGGRQVVPINVGHTHVPHEVCSAMPFWFCIVSLYDR